MMGFMTRAERPNTREHPRHPVPIQAINHVTPAREGEPLSDASLVELYGVHMNLRVAAVNLGKSILAAESSQVIEPVSVTKLSEQKAGLETMQVAQEIFKIMRNRTQMLLCAL